jgi:hypothetical protein
MSARRVSGRGGRRFAGFLIAVVPLTAFAAIRLGALNIDGAAGSKHEVPVALSGVEAVTSLQFDLRFDPNRVTVGAAKPGAAAPGHRIDSRAIGPGQVRVVMYSTTLAPLGAGNVVQVPVTWSTAGNSGLKIENAQVAASSGAKLDVLVADSLATGTSVRTWWWALLLVPALLVLGWWRRRGTVGMNRWKP